MYRILVVDDEPKIVELLKVCLEIQGMQVEAAYNGFEALKLFRESPTDMVITDIMMPEMDGYKLVEKLREISTVPIMFLTARGDVLDKIKGLNVGADDYVVKPFDPMEAAARVTSALRRCYGYNTQKEEEKIISYGDLSLDVSAMKLLKSGVEVELTAIEYRMISYFMENKGRILTKNQIYETVWEQEKFADDNSIMVAISKLRGKINDESHDYIKTIRGLGYRFEG